MPEPRLTVSERLRALARHPGLHRLSGTFLNQGVVSAGGFIVTITLARGLPSVEYGIFALVFSGLYTLQLCNNAVMFYPMSVRVPTATQQELPPLLGASMILLAGLSILLGVVLTAGLAAFGRYDLIGPALLCFFMWQVQEGLRRGLLNCFRHMEAVPGDAITYGGQAACIAGLSAFGLASVTHAFLAIALFAALGAIAHASRLVMSMPSWAMLRAILVDFWSIGGAASLGNGFLAQARNLLLPWAMAAISGPAGAAAYQAVSNIINLANPLIVGLCNVVVPQAAAARTQRDGNAGAWRAVRGYILVGAVPMLLYTAVNLAVPETVLLVFYGAGSEYAGLGAPLRLLIVAGFLGFVIEVVVGFLLGIAAVRQALLINLAGAICVLVLIPPLVSLYGLVGGCFGMLVAGSVRLALVRLALVRITAIPIVGPAGPGALAKQGAVR